MAAPKFFVGESYGGFRGPLIAEKLQEEIGVGLSGMVLLSPVLDFGWLETPRANPWGYVLKLPSLAAGALERKGTVPTPALLGEAEAYASGPYLTDLLKGPSDAAAVARMTDKVAPLVGLDAALVRARRPGCRRGASSGRSTGPRAASPAPTTPASPAGTRTRTPRNRASKIHNSPRFRRRSPARCSTSMPGR